MKPIVFVFVKAPLMGKAKTRLAADIGRVHAQRIYRGICARVFRELSDPRWETVLYTTPKPRASDDFGGLWPRSWPRLAQGEGGLSPRLGRIFATKGPVLTIGTDVPEIRRADIASAIKALKSDDAVIGPAKDGGFWLLGLNGPARQGLFDNIRWSHRETLNDLRYNLTGSVANVRTLEDIDDGPAWQRFKSRKAYL